MSPTFARRVFTIAWIWGLVSLPPMFFLESLVARETGAPVSPPEYYYGFLGTAAAFQVVFYLIARDPLRLRPVMIAGVAEKLAFVIVALVLVALGRTQAGILPFAAIDAVLGALFIAAFKRTRSAG
jgi:hypothetical protein